MFHRRFLLPFFLSFLLFLISASPSLALVPLNNGYKFIGVNSIHLTEGLFDDNGTMDQLRATTIENSLRHLSQDCSVSVVRLFATDMGNDYPLESLKYVLSLGSKYGIKFVIALGNAFRMLPSNDTDFLVTPDPLEYEQKSQVFVRELSSQYYSAILAWELINEPHCHWAKDKYDPQCPQKLNDFVAYHSSWIKQIAPAIPVLVGQEAKHDDEASADQWAKIAPTTGPHAASDIVALNYHPTIDALTIHPYGGDAGNVENLAERAAYLNKPFFTEEYNSQAKEEEKKRDIQNMIAATFNNSGVGFLLWEYSLPLPGSSGDEYRFSDGDTGICDILRESASIYDIPPPIPYELEAPPFMPVSYRRTPANCNLESNLVAPINIGEPIVGVPDNEVIDPNNKSADYYRPYNTSQKYICDTTITISQTFSPRLVSTGRTDPDTGAPIYEYTPYNPDQIADRIEKNEVSNRGAPNAEQFANPPDNFHQSPSERRDALSNYTGISAAYRMTSAKSQTELKDRLLLEVPLFLDPHPDGSVDTDVNEEQVAWGCQDQCFHLGCGKPQNQGSCRPIYLSEIAWYRLVYRPQPFNEKIVQNYSSDQLIRLKSILSQYYSCNNGSCGYLLEHSQTDYFQLLKNECYQKIYDNLNLVSTGSLDTTVLIHNQDTGSTETTQVTRMIPAGKTLNTQFTQLIKNIIPDSAQDLKLTNCRVIDSEAAPDTTNPIRASLIYRLWETLRHIFVRDQEVEVSQDIPIQIIIPESTMEAASYGTQANKFIIPQHIQDKYPSDSNFSKVEDDPLSVPDPAQDYYDTQQKASEMILPESWKRSL